MTSRDKWDFIFGAAVVIFAFVMGVILGTQL